MALSHFRHFSSLCAMTIDQNGQTESERANELSGVTDPLFVPASVCFDRSGVAEAKGQVPSTHHCHCQCRCRRRNSRHFARSMADHRLPRRSMGHKTEATRADRSTFGRRAVCRSRTWIDSENVREANPRPTQRRSLSRWPAPSYPRSVI